MLGNLQKVFNSSIKCFLNNFKRYCQILEKFRKYSDHFWQISLTLESVQIILGETIFKTFVVFRKLSDLF